MSDPAPSAVYIGHTASRVHLAATLSDRSGCGRRVWTTARARPDEIPSWRYCKSCLAAFGGYANATREATR